MFEAMRTFRQKLSEGKVCVGAGVTLSDSGVVEALAPAVDFLWIDMEHTSLSYETVHRHLIAARAGGAAALVRTRGSGVASIKPLLDVGAQGIIVPQVRSADEVRSVVENCRYAPLGRRGYGPRRPAEYGRRGGLDYMAEANREIFIAVQIENRDALAELDAIAAIDGLDSLALGPYDMAIELGYAGEVTHPEVLTVLRRIIAAAKNAGKFVGTGMGAYVDNTFDAVGLGIQWIQSGDDYGYMVDYADELMAGIRRRAAERRG